MVSLKNYQLIVNYNSLAKFILAVVVIYSFIGSAPFSTDANSVDYTETGGGSLFRQLFFSICWLVSLFVFTKIGEIFDFKKILGVIIILAWCTISVIWAVEPGVSFRRVLLLTLNVTTIMMLVSILNKEEIIDVVAKTFALLLVVSVIAIPIIPGAVHQNAELFDTGLAGNWKGIFIHKNLGAPAAVFGLFLFLYKFSVNKNKTWLLLALLAVIFVLFSKSKTSLALILPSLVFAYFLSNLLPSNIARRVGGIILFTLLMISVSLHEYVLIAFDHVLDDPEAFTGRATIWNLIYLALEDHFWLGLGFGSVWQVGDNMVLASYAFGWVDWVFSLSHSHNGLLEAFISTGFIGFSLVLFFLFIHPFLKIIQLRSVSHKMLYLSFFFFFCIHNMIETDILNASDGRWFVFLIVYFLIVLKGDEEIWKKGSFLK